MGLLSKFVGGSDKSQQQTSSSVSTVTNIGASEGSIALGGGGVVNVLDAGAIKESFEFAEGAVEGALDFAEGAGRDAFDFAARAGDQSFDFARENARQFSNSVNDSFDRAFQFASDTLGILDRGSSELQRTQDRVLSAALSQTSAALSSKSDVEAGGAQRLLYFALAAVAGFLGLVYLTR